MSKSDDALTDAAKFIFGSETVDAVKNIAGVVNPPVKSVPRKAPSKKKTTKKKKPSKKCKKK